MTDPEQNVQELVYDLRSQCDAIRVTKTVRPYRVVICPVNENSAALVVSDGRVMLWELKAHASKSSSILRYSSLNISIYEYEKYGYFSIMLTVNKKNKKKSQNLLVELIYIGRHYRLVEVFKIMQ